MSWSSSWVVGGLTGIVALLLAGFLASRIAEWYQVSSFEGASGYFIVGIALVGFLVGVAIGVIASRSLTAPSFLLALGVAQGVTLGVVLVAASAARLLAHVPPSLHGETLRVAIELRWPEGVQLPALDGAGEWWLRLSSVSGGTSQASVRGPLWREDARLEEGRWIVPGAVDLFTERGKRMIDVLPDSLVSESFLIPLPSRPGRDFLEWSAWLPVQPDGQPRGADRFSYRFRVVPSGAPIRSEQVGGFEVATYVRGFGEVQDGAGVAQYTADADYTVQWGGTTLTFDGVERVVRVAILGGERPALLVQPRLDADEGSCVLVVDPGEGSAPQLTPQSPCGPIASPMRITSDPTRFADGTRQQALVGRVDRVSYAARGRYLLGRAILDNQRMEFRLLPETEISGLVDRIAPLGISPDGESLVRLAWTENNAEEVRLAVLHIPTGAVEYVPVDRARTRVADIDLIDPTLVTHYYQWERDAAGVEQLRPRVGVTPLPYRGRLTEDHGYREYRVAPAKEALRDALMEFVASEFGGEIQPPTEGSSSGEVIVDGRRVSVRYEERDRHVGLWMDNGVDSSLVVQIAMRFNAALATGRYDHLFAH